jgi:group II intron reverse transcriptase/maturase
LQAGHEVVVDIDLASFFDRVNHQRLLDRLNQQIGDRDLIRLIGRMMKAKIVLPDGVRVSTEEGVPQGGPLSPLLSNIVLDELDRELERRGHRFVRYADDCRVFVRSIRAGERTMKGLCRFIERRLRLKVNAAKSAVDRSRKRPFLGLEIGLTRKGRAVIRPSQRSLKRIRQRLRELIPRNAGRSLKSIMERLNSYLRGWMGFFQVCSWETRLTLKYLDAHIRRRLRAIVIAQKKRARHLYRFLLKRGAGWRPAAKVAFSRRGPWWQSKRPGIHQALPNACFEASLVSLLEVWYGKRRQTSGPA